MPIAAWSEDGALANAGRRRRRLALQTGTARLIVIVHDVPRRGGRAVLPLNLVPRVNEIEGGRHPLPHKGGRRAPSI